MKSLKTFILPFLSVLVLAFSACTHDHKSETNTVKEETQSKVPELKERDVALGTNEEMDNIRNIYDKSVKALESNPSDIESRLTLSEVFITEARLTGNHAYNYEAALQVLDEVLSSAKAEKDQRFRALMNKATVKLSLHKFDEALVIGKDALALNNRNAGIYGVLVDANVELGNYKAAVEMSDKMVSIRPDLRSYSRISYLREIHGDIEGAKEAMDMAVKAGYPGMEQTEWARIKLGEIYEQYGDLKTAEMHYTIALRERPNYPFALAAMGRLERKKGDLAKSEEFLTRATQYMNYAGFHALLADTYKAQGEEQLADESYKRALKIMEYGNDEKGTEGNLDGEDGHLHLADNDGHEHGGDHSHGHEHADDTGHGHQHGLEVARLYMKMGNQTVPAMENAQIEYKMRPNNIDINKELALIYYKEDKLDKASEHLTKAMATNSKDPELYSLKGLIAIKQGDALAGKQMIRESFKTNPWQDAPTTGEAEAVVS